MQKLTSNDISFLDLDIRALLHLDVKSHRSGWQRFLRSMNASCFVLYLKNRFKVFVMTPQCLVEAVLHKEVKITDFSLLVLDECHHVGLGKHAYKGLMDVYMDAKFDENASNNPPTENLPQVRI